MSEKVLRLGGLVEFGHRTGTVGKFPDGHVNGIEHRDEEVGEGNLAVFLESMQPAVLESEFSSAGQVNGIILGVVRGVRVSRGRRWPTGRPPGPAGA